MKKFIATFKDFERYSGWSECGTEEIIARDKEEAREIARKIQYKYFVRGMDSYGIYIDEVGGESELKPYGNPLGKDFYRA